MGDVELDSVNRTIAAAIRERRLAAQITVADLARLTGLSKTILGRIESGRGNPSVETLYRICRALGVPLSSVIGEPEAPRARLIRSRSGPQLDADSGMATWLMLAGELGHHIELYELDLPAGSDQRSPGHLVGTQEVVVCLAGRIRVGPVSEEVELGVGDTAWFRADGEHHYVALRAARALNVIGYPTRA